MGILGELLKGRRKFEIEVDKSKLEKPVTESNEVKTYNRLWLSKIERDTGFVVSDNEKRVDNILKKLNERDGHCPCGGMTEEFICPCRMMREYGKCKCGLYRNAVDLNPRESSSSGRIKEE